MEILRWQAGNTLGNYQYIVTDGKKNAALIDPLDTTEIAGLVKKLGLKVRAILVSHEHNDHAAEAAAQQKKYSVPVYCSPATANAISADATPLADRDTITISADLAFKAHATPGHTPGHMVFECDGLLFSGDCLFHGGCGHCRSAGASIEEHFHTLTVRLAALNQELILMPGHYYARRNLDFALHVEHDNQRARDLRSRLTTNRDELQHQTTIRQEKDYNPFLRTASRSLRRRVSELTGRNLTESSDLGIFVQLRALRDSW